MLHAILFTSLIANGVFVAFMLFARRLIVRFFQRLDEHPTAKLYDQDAELDYVLGDILEKGR